MRFSFASPHIFVQLDVQNVDKMEVFEKLRLRDEASAFGNFVNVFLNEAYFRLHEYDFGF